MILHPAVKLLLLFIVYFCLCFGVSCGTNWFLNEPFDYNWPKHIFKGVSMGLLYLTLSHWVIIKNTFRRTKLVTKELKNDL